MSMSEQELADEFADIRGLRGRRRAAAVSDLAECGEDLLPALDRFLSDRNQSVRTMAVQLLQEITPDTEAGAARLSATLTELLTSPRPTMQAAALARIAALGNQLRGVEAAVGRFAAIAPDETTQLRALQILTSRGLADADVIAAAEPLLDSWSFTVATAAAEAIRSRGGTPPEPMEHRAPLDPEVLRQIQRLGGRCSEAFDPEAARPIHDSFASPEHGSWTVDPLGRCTEVPPAIQFFEHNIEWTRGTHFQTRVFGERREFAIAGDGENFDTVVKGARVVLLSFVYDEMSQFYYCHNLLDRSDDPAVHGIAHDGSGAHLYSDTLSRFLARLWF